ncbi:hypothetical protein CRENBAI_024677, partial [Crenichthys baileyi]
PWGPPYEVRLPIHGPTDLCPPSAGKGGPPEAALIEADFPHSLEKKAGTTSHGFLCAHLGSETYLATLRPLKEPNVPLLYGFGRARQNEPPYPTATEAQDNVYSARFP